MSSYNPLGTPFIELPSVDSTNNYAMGLVRAGMAHHGTAVFAHEQTKGRGQRTKEWSSEGGKNIAISFIIEPELISTQQIFFLSMAMAVGTLNFFNNLTGNEALIKWPNDIYWRDRKAAGILIQNIWQGNSWKYAVVGIGINVNQVEFGLLGTRAVSLKQIKGKEENPLHLARELGNYLEDSYQLLKNDPAAIATLYRKQLYKLNQPVKLKTENRIFEAVIIGVSDLGQLEVNTDKTERFDVGEVEWII